MSPVEAPFCHQSRQLGSHRPPCQRWREAGYEDTAANMLAKLASTGMTPKVIDYDGVIRPSTEGEASLFLDQLAKTRVSSAKDGDIFLLNALDLLSIQTQCLPMY
eukprot:Selendium_serpulae@DN9153_c0_g1_i1.p3